MDSSSTSKGPVVPVINTGWADNKPYNTPASEVPNIVSVAPMRLCVFAPAVIRKWQVSLTE